jgi:ATP-binding cassette subfamily B protein
LSKPRSTNFFDYVLLKRVLRFAAPYKKRFYFSIVLSIILAIFTPIRPYLIQRTVDVHIAGYDYSWVVIITIIQIAFLLLETGLRFYFSYITSWLGQSVVKDLRVTVYKKVLHLNLRQFDKTPIGTLTYPDRR